MVQLQVCSQLGDGEGGFIGFGQAPLSDCVNKIVSLLTEAVFVGNNFIYVWPRIFTSFYTILINVQ